jgi:GT2 family glycosyltransferase/glycosyltransferase involved in cell wall biosynthesis
MREENDLAFARTKSGSAESVSPPRQEPAPALRCDAESSGPLLGLIRAMFNSVEYLWLYQDIAEAAAAPGFDVFGHFVNFGNKEKRSPSLLFDVGYVTEYLNRIERLEITTDMAMAAFAALPDARRFIPNRWFSPWAFRMRYGAQYEELTQLSDYECFLFYRQNVAAKGFSPCGLFNEEAYRAGYGDVAAMIADGRVASGFMHFIMQGEYEGRCNLPGYGIGESTAAQSAVLLGHVPDPGAGMLHYDEEFYLSVYEDVHALKRQGRVKSGLEHFIAAGCREGRLPHPTLLRDIVETAPAEGWDFLALVAPRRAAVRLTVSLAEACRVRDHVAAQAGAASPRRITDALWPFIERPAVTSRVDAAHYLLVNPDIAAFTRNDPAVAQQHWEDYGFAEQRAAPGTNFFERRGISLKAILDWRDGVNFFGPLSSKSGLGQAARGYIAALKAAGIPIVTYDVSVLLQASMPGDLFDPAALPYSINLFFLNADQTLPFIRKYGADCLDNRANIAAWVWELPSPLPEWRATLSAFDLIIVPSQFTAASFSLFTDTPVEIIPYPVDAAALRGALAEGAPDHWHKRLAAEKAKGKRIILSILDASSYTARKGLDIFEALAADFQQSHPDAFSFVLKTHSRDYSLGDEFRLTSKSLMIIDGIMHFNDLCRLKALADVYVSPHRSEGFGLNIFESILLGVPAVCSGFGGPVDLLGPDYPYLVSGGLMEVGRDMGPYRAAAVWFKPDEAVLRARLLAALAETAGQDTARRGEALATALSAAAIGARFREVLGKYCGLREPGHESELERFVPLTDAPKDECFTFALPESLTGEARAAHLQALVSHSGKPFFSIITPAYNSDPAWLEELYLDLINQSYPHWEWCISDDASTRPETIACLKALRKRDARIQIRFGARNAGISENTNHAAQFAAGRYLVMIDHDDRVAPELLKIYRTWIGERKEATLLYCDEDKIDAKGRPVEAYYKPDFSPEHLMSCMYILHCLCVRKSLFLELGGYRAAFTGAQDHDFVLRAASAGTPIWHVDERLYHWRMTPGSAAASAAAKDYAPERGRLAVLEHLRRAGLQGTVEHGPIPGTYRPRPALPAEPVSLNILTGCAMVAGAEEPTSYVECFVKSILDHRPPEDFELRIVVEAERLVLIAHLAALDPRIRLVPYVGAYPGFNFAEKANFSVRTSTHERVVLLNDDMLALDDEWLTALLEMLEINGVGAVGGRLTRPAGTIQHAGIVLGIAGICAHVFENCSQTDIGYNAFPRIIRNYSAVTGAMLAFRKSAFEMAGGFDETYPIDYNDVDFCLKMREAGLRVVYTPYARLVHFESRSARRLVADSIDARRFARKWDAQIKRDPFYNIHLTRTGVLFEEAAPG